MYSQNVLRRCMSPRATFSNSITFTVTCEYGKDAGVKLSGPFTTPVDGSSLTRLLDIYLTTPFEVRNFGNTSAMRVIFF